MIDKLIALALKKYGFDKYVYGATLNPVTSTYKLTVARAESSVVIGFEIMPEFRDEADLFFKFLS